MARARNVKPGFFKNEDLAECSPLARLLFAGLWCIADRAGRLEDRPKRIRAEILPYDDGSVDDMLNELHQAGFILRYQAAGRRYIQVMNFGKHQNPHHREPESTIPAPDRDNSCPEQAQDKPQAGPGQSQGNAEESPRLAQDKPATGRADSLNLIPDSLNPITATSPAGDPPAYPTETQQADDGAKRALSVRELIAEGVERQHAEDWLKARRAKKLPLTRTALDGVKTEAEKAGMTLPQAIARAAEEGWAGFKMAWVVSPGGGRSRHGMPGAHAGFEHRDYGVGGRL